MVVIHGKKLGRFISTSKVDPSAFQNSVLFWLSASAKEESSVVELRLTLGLQAVVGWWCLWGATIELSRFLSCMACMG